MSIHDDGTWVCFNDDGFPFAFGVARYVTREEMVKDFADRLARIELVTDDAERKRLLDIHIHAIGPSISVRESIGRD